MEVDRPWEHIYGTFACTHICTHIHIVKLKSFYNELLLNLQYIIDIFIYSEYISCVFID